MFGQRFLFGNGSVLASQVQVFIQFCLPLFSLSILLERYCLPSDYKFHADAITVHAILVIGIVSIFLWISNFSISSILPSAFIIMVTTVTFIILATTVTFIIMVTTVTFIIMATTVTFIIMATTVTFIIMATTETLIIMATTVTFIIMATTVTFIIMATNVTFIFQTPSIFFDPFKIFFCISLYFLYILCSSWTTVFARLWIFFTLIILIRAGLLFFWSGDHLNSHWMFWFTEIDLDLLRLYQTEWSCLWDSDCVRILRRVLETWEDLLSLIFHWLPQLKLLWKIRKYYNLFLVSFPPSTLAGGLSRESK